MLRPSIDEPSNEGKFLRPPHTARGGYKVYTFPLYIHETTEQRKRKSQNTLKLSNFSRAIAQTKPIIMVLVLSTVGKMMISDSTRVWRGVAWCLCRCEYRTKNESAQLHATTVDTRRKLIVSIATYILRLDLYVDDMAAYSKQSRLRVAVCYEHQNAILWQTKIRVAASVKNLSEPHSFLHAPLSLTLLASSSEFISKDALRRVHFVEQAVARAFIFHSHTEDNKLWHDITNQHGHLITCRGVARNHTRTMAAYL